MTLEPFARITQHLRWPRMRGGSLAVKNDNGSEAGDDAEFDARTDWAGNLARTERDLPRPPTQVKL